MELTSSVGDGVSVATVCLGQETIYGWPNDLVGTSFNTLASILNTLTNFLSHSLGENNILRPKQLTPTM